MPLSPQPLFILTCLCSSLSSSSFLLLLFSASLSHSKCSAFFFSSDSRHVFVLASNRKCDRIFVCPFMFKVVWMPVVCMATSVSTGVCLCIIASYFHSPTHLIASTSRILRSWADTFNSLILAWLLPQKRLMAIKNSFLDSLGEEVSQHWAVSSQFQARRSSGPSPFLPSKL